MIVREREREGGREGDVCVWVSATHKHTLAACRETGGCGLRFKEAT